MIGILLSDYDFGEGALHDELNKYINSGMKIVVIPFSHDMQKMKTVDDYNRYSNRGGEYFELLARQFVKLGIHYDNIDLVHYYYDNISTMKQKIESADMLFLTGGLPDKTVERLKEKDLINTIKSFKGIIAGASAGALIQLPEYFCTPDDDYTEFMFFEGLGLAENDFYIEVHYEGTELLDSFPVLKDKNKLIYALSSGTGLIYEGKNVKLIGDIRIFK